MAWNEPGKGKKDPWSNGGNGGPPDLDEVIRNIQNKFGRIFGNNSSGDSNSSNGGALGLSLILSVVLIVWLISGFYIIDPAERGVVLQFSSYKKTTFPGPHWHVPYPVERVEVVNVEESRTAEIGFRSTAGRSGNIASEIRHSLEIGRAHV